LIITSTLDINSELRATSLIACISKNMIASNQLHIGKKIL